MENTEDKIKKLRQNIQRSGSLALPKLKQNNGIIIVTEIFSPIFVGALLGKFIDNKFDTFPYCMLGMLTIGFFSGFYTIYKISKNKDS